MQNNTKELDALVSAVSAMIVAECQSLAKSTGQDAETVAQDVAATVKRVIGRRTKAVTAAAAKHDGRATTYATRVQLIYGQSIMADSHPELEMNTFGDIEITGLINVPDLAYQMASAFHADHDPGQAINWPGDEELDRRMKTVRVTLARGAGRGRWRVPYTVGADEWMAFILIATPQRVEFQRIADTVPPTTYI